MLRMCVYMHSRFVENHPIRILGDGLLISEGVLSQSHCWGKIVHHLPLPGEMCCYLGNSMHLRL
jgi:hypothetical protein